MNKSQAYQAMCQGHKVCNEYYGPEEYAFINDNDYIETEDGCVMGNQYDEFWKIYQDPECKFEWSIWKSKEDLEVEPITKQSNSKGMTIDSTREPYIIYNKYDYTPAYYQVDRSPKFTSKNSHKRSNKRK